LENSVPFDNTTPIYLINLLWKLWLGIRVGTQSCSILNKENKENEHINFREFTDGNTHPQNKN